MRLSNNLSHILIIIFAGLLYSTLLAISSWVQFFPEEFRSLILRIDISEIRVINSFIFHWILFSVILFIVHSILLILKRKDKKLDFNYVGTLKLQLKSQWPLCLLVFMPLRSFVHIGSQYAWFDQTTFYFALFYILILSISMFNVVRTLNPPKLPILTTKQIKIILVFIIGVSFLFFSYFSILRLTDLRIEKPDIHAFITVLWNFTHGNGLQLTYLDTPRSWFSVHFEPLLLLFSPLFLLPLPSVIVPMLLQILQVAIGVSGVIPIFLFAKKKLGSNYVGLLLGIIYLLLPALQFQLLYDFHPEIIAVVCALWALYFLEERKYKPFLLSLALIVLVREEFALYASIFGVYMILCKNFNKKLGVILTIGGVGYLLFIKLFVLQFFGGGVLSQAQLSMMPDFSTKEFIRLHTPIEKTRYFLDYLFTQRKIQYLFLMFSSVGFLSLLSPVVILSLPYFLMNLLLNFDLPSSIFWHYQAWLIPILLWATVDLLSKREPKNRASILVFMSTCALLTSLIFGPINIMHLEFGNTQRGIDTISKNSSLVAIKQAVDSIPRKATVSADTSLTPYFASRKSFYLYPDTQSAQFIVLSSQLLLTRSPEVHISLIKMGYCLKRFDSVLVYKKMKKCSKGWNDTIVEVSRNLEPDEKINTLIYAKNNSSASYPIHANKTNIPAIVLFKTRLEKDKNTLLSLIHYQMLARSPSHIKILGSKDGKNFSTMADCSALKDIYCESRFDATKYANNKGDLFIKLYLFAETSSAKKLKNTVIERVILRTLSVKTK